MFLYKVNIKNVTLKLRSLKASKEVFECYSCESIVEDDSGFLLPTSDLDTLDSPNASISYLANSTLSNPLATKLRLNIVEGSDLAE